MKIIKIVKYTFIYKYIFYKKIQTLVFKKMELFFFSHGWKNIFILTLYYYI